MFETSVLSIDVFEPMTAGELTYSGICAVYGATLPVTLCAPQPIPLSDASMKIVLSQRPAVRN